MKFETIVAPTITELFENQIQKAILSGQLAIGEKLPTEQELANNMNVSKSIVHIGIKNLERQGFVRIVPRHGIYVANYPEEGNIDTLMALLKVNDGTLDQNNITSLLTARQGVEGIQIKLMAENHTDEEIADLRRLLDNIKAAAFREPRPDPDEVAEELFKFHRYITRSNNNTVTPMIFNAFHDVIVVYWAQWVRKVSPEVLFQTEEIMADYIEQGKGDAASDLLYQTMTKYLGEEADSHIMNR